MKQSIFTRHVATAALIAATALPAAALAEGSTGKIVNMGDGDEIFMDKRAPEDRDGSDKVIWEENDIDFRAKIIWEETDID